MSDLYSEDSSARIRLSLPLTASEEQALLADLVTIDQELYAHLIQAGLHLATPASAAPAAWRDEAEGLVGQLEDRACRAACLERIRESRRLTWRLALSELNLLAHCSRRGVRREQGMLLLYQAARSFKHSPSLRFSTYCLSWLQDTLLIDQPLKAVQKMQVG